ncbi:MAG TPA: cysteine dioxygenase family protein [Trinickia sp.]|jgi:predicted metal-dependent enzyme (double-stranded beta helix superfamily)|uniref:cysteine dioxygenase family protein n=1 Tax=Trinickia sp. TaxID=2571163 RepID=UPI002C59F54E|nr:cysteine dioxygenase family protein [Trinickia sp.]HTI17119.1 cysteine dioxygenase family protein [Trinickia sp.]
MNPAPKSTAINAELPSDTIGITGVSAPSQAADAIARLSEALDAAYCAAAGVAEPSHCAEFAHLIHVALAHAAGDDMLLTPQQRESSRECYRRHLLTADPLGRYAVVALVWGPGQMSPVHAHHTWCSYAVLSGELTETLYEWNETQGCATPARTRVRTPGAVSYTPAGMTGIHRLGAAGPGTAVSLHVYGVTGQQVATHVNDLVRVAP